jgi:Ca2+-binding RTX toxin-like protein
MTAGGKVVKRSRRRLVALAFIAALVASCWTIAGASGDVSHTGWPHTVTVWFATNSGQVGVGTDGNDMLLGGAGSDTIHGGPGNDIIWGDRHPSPNGANQTDNLYGGMGNDWIYTSHGTNHVYAGPGDDSVFAYFGHGTIDCGSGYDVLTLDRTTEHSYAIRNCEVVRIGYP